MAQTIPVPKGDFEASLGAIFRAERRARGVWLRELAKQLDVSVNTIRWHESGARMLRADHLVKAASIMGIPPAALLPSPDNMPISDDLTPPTTQAEDSNGESNENT